MNILLFHQHFNTPESGGAIRSYYLATALARHGHRVTVITSCACPKGSTVRMEGMEVVYLAIPYDNRFTFAARIWSFIRFAVAAIRAAKPYRHYDLCYAISVPLTVGLCARWMKWRHGMPYWFEVGDLWPDAPIQLGYLRNPLINRVLFAFERSTYRKAKGVVALSEPIREAVQAKVPGCRVEWVPNMADCDFYSPSTRGTDAEAKYQTGGMFVLSYIGALGVANGLEYFVDCAAAASKSNLPMRFMVCGDGAMLDELKRRAALNGLSNITFTGLLNREAVRDVLRITDAVMISYRPAAILETGCPNKYFDGLAAGKLIVVNFGGWIRKELEENRCGFYANPDDPMTLLKGIEPYFQDRTKLEDAQGRARSLGVARYSRSEISDRFAALVAGS